MKCIPSWRSFNVIVIILLGVVAIWWSVTPTTSLSAPLQQSGATATPTIHAQLQTTLVAGNGANDDAFGYSVGISGDTVVVGASYDDHSGFTDAGSVYVYVRNGNTWMEQAQLIASDPNTSDFFGNSVAISGDTIVVGAYQNDALGDGAGAAYIYTRTGTTWSAPQKITADDAFNNDYFGNSVSIDRDTIIVGAPGSYGNGTITTDEAAYLFVRSGTTWTQQQKLTVTATPISFGTAVDIFDNTVIISGRASAYIFGRSGTTWTELDEFNPNVPFSAYGNSVAIYDGMIIIGAPGTVSNPGVVFIYEWTGETWELAGNSNPPVGSGYGWAVDIYQNIGIVGHFEASATSTLQPSVGAAYMIEVNDDGSISTLNTFRQANPAVNDVFGFSVARDGWTIVISSPNRDYAALTNAGVVNVYTVNGPPWRTATPTAIPMNAVVNENEFFAALENAAVAYPDIVTIVPDFVANAINMTVAINGVAGNVTVAAREAQGFVTLSITSITVNGAAAPANYVNIINRDLPQILTAALDNLVMERFGSLVNVQSITIGADTMTLSTQS